MPNEGKIGNGGAVIIDDGGRIIGGERPASELAVQGVPIRIRSDYALDGIASDYRRAVVGVNSTDAQVLVEANGKTYPFDWADVEMVQIGKGQFRVICLLSAYELQLDVFEKCVEVTSRKEYHMKDRGPIDKVDVFLRDGGEFKRGHASLTLCLPNTPPRP